MRAGDGDRPRRPAPAAASTCARAQTGIPRSRAATQLGVALADRAGDHDGVGIAEARGVVADPRRRARGARARAVPSSPSGRIRSPRCPARGAASPGCACRRRRCRSCAPCEHARGRAPRGSGCCPGGGRVDRVAHDATSTTSSASRAAASGRAHAAARSPIVRAPVGLVGEARDRWPRGRPPAGRRRPAPRRRRRARARARSRPGGPPSRAGTGSAATRRPHTVSSAMLVAPARATTASAAAYASSMRSRNGSGRTRSDMLRDAGPRTTSRCRGPVRTSSWRSSRSRRCSIAPATTRSMCSAPRLPPNTTHRRPSVLEVRTPPSPPRAARPGSPAPPGCARAPGCR